MHDTIRRPPQHTNVFVDLNGVPYLLAEYLDRTQFRHIDRSIIRNDIFIDQSESMRAIVDINIDNIGRRTDGFPKVQGNITKQGRLLTMIRRHFIRLNGRLDVLRRGVIVRVNYQLENLRTGQVIRSTSENLRIRDRNYFIDINPRDINNNAIIVNFLDTLVSSINQFTHGRERMQLRITSIQLFYEELSRRQDRVSPSHDILFDNHFSHRWHHHNRFQPHHDFHNLPFEEHLNFHPPSWMMFNRFYRFDNMGRDIILHKHEINDRMNRVRLVPCGTVNVNRAFIINPGHRIVFKISIWSNDVTSFHNTQRIAKALGAQHLDSSWDRPRPRPPVQRPPNRRPQSVTNQLLNLLAELKTINPDRVEEIEAIKLLIRELRNAPSDNGNDDGYDDNGYDDNYDDPPPDDGYDYNYNGSDNGGDNYYDDGYIDDGPDDDYVPDDYYGDNDPDPDDGYPDDGYTDDDNNDPPPDDDGYDPGP